MNAAAGFFKVIKNINLVYTIISDGGKVALDLATFAIDCNEAVKECKGSVIVADLITTGSDYKKRIVNLVEKLEDQADQADNVFEKWAAVAKAAISAGDALAHTLLDDGCGNVSTFGQYALAGLDELKGDYDSALLLYQRATKKVESIAAQKAGCVAVENATRVLTNYLKSGCKPESVSRPAAQAEAAFAADADSVGDDLTIEDVVSELNQTSRAIVTSLATDTAAINAFKIPLAGSYIKPLKLLPSAEALQSSLSPNPLHGFYHITYDTTDLRGQLDATGQASVYVPANAFFTFQIFDPTTGGQYEAFGLSDASGGTMGLPGLLSVSSALDTDGDGLTDFAEGVLGSSSDKVDTDGDGLSDFVEVEYGTDPLGGRGTSTGIVASLQTPGSAGSVALGISASDAGRLTAYVASGAAGLSIIDASNFFRPTLLAQLSLPGQASDVALDQKRNLAIVADGGSGLFIIDVSISAAPAIMQSIAIGGTVNRVAVVDGLAYAAVGSSIVTIDLNTGEVLQTIDLANGKITDIAVSGQGLVTFSNTHKLTTISLNNNMVSQRGSLMLGKGSGRIAIAGSTVYIPVYDGFNGGYQTVDISNPNQPVLISDVDSTALGGGAMALNGSGLGLALTTLQGPQGRPVNALDVVDVLDPSDTGKLNARIILPSAPNDVAIANGIAFVADGSAGLQIVNYLGFDTKGVAPTVSIRTDAVDVDPAAAGFQVVEGTTIHVTPTVTDDVQVRNVELLVNGAVVANDPAYPFDFSVAVPAIATAGNTVNIQVRATDTGGNTTTSAATAYSVVPDTFPPSVVATSLAEGARVFFVRSVQVTFSEPLDTARLAVAGVSLAAKGRTARSARLTT